VIDVHDNVLPDPDAYRREALAQPFGPFDAGAVVFHGIAASPNPAFVAWFAATYPQYVPMLTFLRQSPDGQDEPNFIHTDVDMGDVTAILYLTPDPPAEDGTSFWRHVASWQVTGDVLTGAAGKDLSAWVCEQTVPAAFNRCVVFDAARFHSRALPQNYGTGDGARLIQVLFAKEKG
jgi:hypothetical protein